MNKKFYSIERRIRVKKVSIVVLSILLIISLGGCGTKKTTPTVIKPPAPINLTGTGSQFEKVNLTSGVSIFRINHLDTGNLTVNLLSSSGTTLGTIVNQNNQFNISTPFSISASGTYGLTINGNGKWTLTIEQPRPTSAKIPTVPYQGKDTQVTPLFGLNAGLQGIKISYTGDSYFYAYLMNNQGKIVSTLVKKNTPQAYDPSSSFDEAIPLEIKSSGIYFFCVQTNGNWSIQVQ